MKLTLLMQDAGNGFILRTDPNDLAPVQPCARVVGMQTIIDDSSVYHADLSSPFFLAEPNHRHEKETT